MSISNLPLCVPLCYFCNQRAFPFSCCFLNSGEIPRIRHAFSVLPPFSSYLILDKAFNLPLKTFFPWRLQLPSQEDYTKQTGTECAASPPISAPSLELMPISETQIEFQFTFLHSSWILQASGYWSKLWYLAQEDCENLLGNFRKALWEKDNWREVISPA